MEINQIEYIDTATKQVFANFMWQWFHKHKGETIINKKFLFFTIKITVENLEILFIRLFGPDPYAA